MFPRNPVRFHLAIILALCAAGTFAFWWFLTHRQHTARHWVASYLVIVNAVAFGYYGLDKLLASRRMSWRVPEVALHAVSFIGGSPGALLAMWFFRHKTIKPSFRILFWSIVVLQSAILAYIVKLTWWD